MRDLRFELTRSRRICCRGHSSTFEIEGVDEASQEWLADWTLYCDTCQALTLDVGQLQHQRAQWRDEKAIGFVIQVPIQMRITGKGSRP